MVLSVIGKVGLNNKIIFNIRLIQVVYENLKLKLPDFSGFSWPNLINYQVKKMIKCLYLTYNLFKIPNLAAQYIICWDLIIIYECCATTLEMKENIYHTSYKLWINLHCLTQINLIILQGSMVALHLLYPNYTVSKFGDVALGSLIKSISLHVQKYLTQAWWIQA